MSGYKKVLYVHGEDGGILCDALTKNNNNDDDAEIKRNETKRNGRSGGGRH